MLFRAMYADTAAEPLPFALEFIEVKPQETLRLGGVRIDAFHAVHQENPPSLGIRNQGRGLEDRVYRGLRLDGRAY